MLPLVWILPLAAALVALVFAGALARQYQVHRRSYLGFWAVARNLITSRQ